ncbi:hypothetical protein V8Z77_08885 [Stutzerimonas stutzeri]|uniref:hypothetical protein n=1 Tax=Stutzerimonas stutzeri TaxID=316 RepID=UPI0013FD361F|nr:hypothetical protein [Stutzerimonas stutzeri]
MTASFSAKPRYQWAEPEKAKTRRSGFFLTVPNPFECVLAMVDHPDPERVLRFRVGVD